MLYFPLFKFDFGFLSQKEYAIGLMKQLCLLILFNGGCSIIFPVKCLNGDMNAK